MSRRNRSETRSSAAAVLDGSCMDCGVDTISQGEYYSLKDSVWRSINPLVVGHLCRKRHAGAILTVTV